MSTCNDCSMNEVVKEIRDDVKLLLADKHAREGAEAVKKANTEHKRTLLSVGLGILGAFFFDVIKWRFFK